MRRLLLGVLAFGLASCAGSGSRPTNLPTGAAAYSALEATQPANGVVKDYRIGALDTVDVTIFQEPDLSAKALKVDAAGQIALPLIGTVTASGKTASQLSRELELMLGERYLRDPQVTVTIASSVSQKVSVQGEVTEPGIYPISGPTTLLDVLSMAKGETQIASLKEVVIFRNVNNRRMGAVFDVASIRRGEAADPAIQGNDLVVVGYSGARRFWQDVVKTAPVFNVFRPIL